MQSDSISGRVILTGIYHCPSCWCAYVESGASVEERRARLADCPEQFRAEVEAHVRTVFAIRASVRMRKR
jgi:hypothetical protein